MASAARARRVSGPAEPDVGPGRGVAGPERLHERVLRAFIALDLLLLSGYVVAAVGYAVGWLDGSPHFPLITNSVGLYVLLLGAAALLTLSKRFCAHARRRWRASALNGASRHPIGR
jgi:hypothetical protein